MLALPAMAPTAAGAPPPPQAAAPPAEQFPKLALTAPDAAAAGVRRFFTESQYAALEKLCDAIWPPQSGGTFARDADVPAFLDFLISESGSELGEMYRNGLDRLSRDGVNAASLAPLKEAWTYAGPTDAYARFLVHAKEAILQATASSREYAEAASRGRRGGGGLNYYWRSLD